MESVFKNDLLSGQHAVITGAGSGINKHIAQLFASHGAKVSIIGRSIEKSDLAASKIESRGGSAIGLAADVRSYEALESAFVQAREKFGPIDICIAGAAGNFVAEAHKMSANGFRTVVETDLLGTYNTFRAAYPLLRTGGGNLLAISAVQALMPAAAQAHVCSAKAGIEMLVRTLSIEWAGQGIRCNAIAPGPVANTEGMKRLAPNGDSSWARLLSAIPMGRAAELDEIADLALFLCSGASSYINGTSIVIDGGQSNNGSYQFSSMLLDSLKAN